MEYTSNSSNRTASDQLPTRQSFQIHYRPSDAPQPGGSRISSFVPRLTLMLVMFFFILCSIVFIAWLVIHPLDPAIRLSSLSVSNITVSNPQFAANYDIEFTVNNTNKKVNLCVDHVRVVVAYRKGPVSSKILERSEYLGKMGESRLKAELGRDAVRSLKDGEFKDISDEWSKKIVNFNVKLSVRAGFQIGVLPTKQKIMEFRCMNLPVEFLSTKGTGKLMSGGKDCLVHA
ncbi:LATE EMBRYOGENESIS ABUNDANT (LEA) HYDROXYPROLINE-RICH GLYCOPROTEIN FAMILY [Salix viminalis]|uniref:LATE EMBRYOGENESIS ABUNDANT (LEA) HYDROXYPROLINE-RICH GLYCOPROTEIN FAMILY n=1 Tax=Salix viminalis TaxID=40686 RepID=A0A6N2L8J4_SALVM|nr:LATE EMBRYOGENESIS ABUNDANT (LEA) HYDROXYPROLINE-RICH GLYCOPROTEIN FAMILY [Salix viminalis]KAJ6670497.1 LATE EMBRYOGENESIS ABUNDANT (LEA) HYDROXYPROLINE-RICH GLYCOPROTEIN FAMILY [Salix viminalis]